MYSTEGVHSCIFDVLKMVCIPSFVQSCRSDFVHMCTPVDMHTFMPTYLMFCFYAGVHSINSSGVTICRYEV